MKKGKLSIKFLVVIKDRWGQIECYEFDTSTEARGFIEQMRDVYDHEVDVMSGWSGCEE